MAKVELKQPVVAEIAELFNLLPDSSFILN